jgi:S-adenosylmethionine decarboxylase proenzyme
VGIRKKQVATNYLVELSACDPKKIDQLSFVKKTVSSFIKKSGLTAIRSVHHSYKPHGLTVIWILKESHLAYHSWPEFQYVGLDLFVCGKPRNLKKGLSVLAKRLQSKKSPRVTKMGRGPR